MPLSHIGKGPDPRVKEPHYVIGLPRERNQNLTQDLRTQLNKLTSDMNSKLQTIVESNPGVRFADINPLFDGHRFCEEEVTEPDSNNPNIWFFHRDTDGNGRDDAFDQMLMAQLDPKHNATAFQEALGQSTDAFTSLSDFPAQNIGPSSPYESLLQMGDGQTQALQLKNLHLLD